MSLDATLTMAERNGVFMRLHERKFNPDDFEWTEAEQPERFRRGNEEIFRVSVLTHRQTHYYFIFGGIYVIYSPGDGKRLEVQEHLNQWLVRYTAFHFWLNRLEEEVDVPDLWAAKQQMRSEVESQTLVSSEVERTEAPKPGTPHQVDAETARMDLAERNTNRSVLVLFFLGVAASLLPAGLQLIGVTVNLWLGSAMIVTTFMLATLAFWWASGCSKWRIAVRCWIVVVMLGCLYLAFDQVIKEHKGETRSASPQSTEPTKGSLAGNESSKQPQKGTGSETSPLSGNQGTALTKGSFQESKKALSPSDTRTSDPPKGTTTQKTVMDSPAPPSAATTSTSIEARPKAPPSLPNQESPTTSRPKTLQVVRHERGTVKWFNVAKGYGFITGPDGEDVFVHFSAIVEPGHRTLEEGELVEYIVVKGPKGSQAENVRKVVAPAK